MAGSFVFIWTLVSGFEGVDVLGKSRLVSCACSLVQHAPIGDEVETFGITGFGDVDAVAHPVLLGLG